MPYIDNKYTTRTITGSGKFKIGDKVRICYRAAKDWHNEEEVNEKVGIVVEDMFCGVYDYTVRIPQMGDYHMYEEDLISMENALQKLKKRYQ